MSLKPNVEISISHSVPNPVHPVSEFQYTDNFIDFTYGTVMY